MKGEGGKAPSLSEDHSPQVSGRMGQPPGSGSCPTSSSKKADVTGPGASPTVGRNQRWELKAALCAACFDSGAVMGLLGEMTFLAVLLLMFSFCALHFHTEALVCLFTFFFGLGFLSHRLREAGSGGAQLSQSNSSHQRFLSPAAWWSLRSDGSATAWAWLLCQERKLFLGSCWQLNREKVLHVCYLTEASL